jgi:PAS domain S-box-containing protein
MTGDSPLADEQSALGFNAAGERLEWLSRDISDLPTAHQALIRELLMAFSTSVEELQVTTEELHQQNQELLAAQQELEVQRRHYHDLFELAPSGYIVTDAAGLIKDANQAAVKLLGVPKLELKGKPLIVYVAPGEWNRFHTYLDRLVGVRGASERAVELEIHFQPRQGPAFPAALTAAPVLDTEGELTGFRWLLRDMTASERAEEREQLLGQIQELVVILEQEQQILQTIMENTPVQLAYLDPDFNFVRMNSAYAEGSGHTREELIGHNHFDFFPSPENQAIFEGVRDIGQPVAYHARPFEYPDQQERGITYWDWTLVPVKGEAGKTQGLVFSLRDVTEEVAARRRIEELAAQSQRQAIELRAIFNAMSEAVVVLDTDGKGIYANPSSVRLYGLDPTDSDRIKELLLPSPEGANYPAVDVDGPMRIQHLSMRHPDGRRLRAEELPSARSLCGESVVHEPIYLRNIKGEEFVVHASASPLFEGDRITGAVVVLHDVTAREQAEQARDRLIDILETTPDIISTASVDGNGLYLNQAARKILGIPETADLSELAIPQLHPAWADEIIQTHGIPTAMREGMWRGETAILSQDGREIPVSQVILAHKGLEGSVEYLSTIARDVTERKKHQAQLEAERARLRAVIDSAPEAIVVVDQESRIVLANPAAEQLYPRPVPYGQDFETHSNLALCDPNGTPYDPRQLPLTRSALDGQTSQNVEMAVCGPGDQRHDLLVSSAPIRDKQGTVTGAVGVFQDITERRQTQQALQRYAERLRILHETDQAILAARSMEEIAEVPLSQVQQLVPGLRASLTLFDLEGNEAAVLAAKEEGETRLAKGWRGPIGSEWPIETLAQGQIHVVEETRSLPASSPLLQALQGEGLRSYINVPLLAQGTLLGSLNLGMPSPGSLGSEDLDIAREVAAQLAVGIQQAHLHQQVQHHAEELEQRVARRTAALQASQARLRAIFDGAAIGIALSDTKGHILESNPAFQAMLGYSAGELREMAFTDFTHPEDIAADQDLFRELVAGKRERYSLDKRYIRKDGRIIWARLAVSSVQSGPEPGYAIGLVEDVTEEKGMQDALLKAEKLAIAGQLGASLAHEINNPLQSVIGCLGLADKNLAEGADVSRYLRVAREELRRAAGIVAQFRDLHRLSEPEEKKATDLNALLEQVLLLCKKKCEECRIQLSWNAADNLPPIPMVSDRMRQVFLNLILNALDATPEGGQLEIRTAATAVSEAAPAGVHITFTNSGSGIAPDELPHLFEPFYSTKPQGLGLGLYITRNIVEAHGGRIDVSSRLGEGTTFSVWLPA